MSQSFFDAPILNSPYAYPGRHWELDTDGQPTDVIANQRRKSSLVTPVPKPKKKAKRADQTEMVLGAGDDLSTLDQEYNPTPIINEIRQHVESWRALPNPSQWMVTPETARLLQHWRGDHWEGIRPFFCQVEAVETAIWLAEVAPKMGPRFKKFRAHLDGANAGANPELFRIALKLATGAGKTTVMAMLIAWQTINARRSQGSKLFTDGFLLITPGITIKDRLRVLQPNDPDSYYRTRQLVPQDMLGELNKAKIVITNYHAFKLRETVDVASGTRKALEGHDGPMKTLETEGRMIRRVMPELMGVKNVIVINDEAHHCYRERPGSDDAADLKGDDKDEAKKNNEAARLWISGIEAVKRKLGVKTVYDLSATPFFLKGSGWEEGTLFPWTVSDFSLMDAIECGIVKLPRVPISDNVPGGDTPKYRNLWEHIGKDMPKKGRRGAGELDPLSLPLELCTALDALYGHYEETFALWRQAGIDTPPVFIVVCNNTTTSQLVHDYIAGFHRDDDENPYQPGKFELFRNYDEFGNPLSRPRTLLIDSEQLDSGEALTPEFRKASETQIARYKRELVERTGDATAADRISESDLLREVMNTVGKTDALGESIRCVVSVSMLTEGWDCNTVTHVLGVRAFGTQLLCEQVIGRALRRQSYELNEQGLFNVEYADVLGIPFDFAAKPVKAKVNPPRETVRVHAVRPERDHLEIRFPRVEGYRTELPDTQVTAVFSESSKLILSPDLVGPTEVRTEGIIGEGADMSIEHLRAMRKSTIIYHLAKHLLYNKYRDPGEAPPIHLFGQIKRVVKQWMDQGYLECVGGTFPGQLTYLELADRAAEKIKQAISAAPDDRPESERMRAILDPYNPAGTSHHVNFTTSRDSRWTPDPRKCPVNWVILDSDREAEFCRLADAHPRVLAYVKNHNLGFEIPYLYGSQKRRYRPDFIVRLDDGRDDPLNLVVEISGYPSGDKPEKTGAMNTYWIPGVNNLKRYGRWAFAEFADHYQMKDEFNRLIDGLCAKQGA
ncbi:MAG: DEAD/DEAH box helicase family protein [Oceanicaulis sp.]